MFSFPHPLRLLGIGHRHSLVWCSAQLSSAQLGGERRGEQKPQASQEAAGWGRGEAGRGHCDAYIWTDAMNSVAFVGKQEFCTRVRQAVRFSSEPAAAPLRTVSPWLAFLVLGRIHFLCPRKETPCPNFTGGH